MTVAATGGGHEAPSVGCVHVLVDSVWRVVRVACEVDEDLGCACVRVCVRCGRVGKVRDCHVQMQRLAYIGQSPRFRARAKH